MKTLYLLIMLCTINLWTTAQSGTWKHYNVANSGLPSDYIRAIVQENDSIYWIGTNAGAVRYNGHQWTVFSKANSGLPGNNVRSIVIDGRDKWFGTLGGGIAKFDDSVWTVYDTANSPLPDNNVLHVSMDKGGSLWIGVAGDYLNGNYGGATRFDKVNQWTNYIPSNSGIASTNVRYVEASDTNEIWFGTTGGVSKMAGNVWTTYNTANSPLPYDDVRGIARDAHNNLWFGTYSGGGPTGGIAKYDHTHWTVYDTSNSSLLANSVAEILVDRCNNIWCGSYYLHRFDGNTWLRYDTANSIIDNYSVFAFAEDNHNNIWIGTFGGILMFENDCFVDPLAVEESEPDLIITIYPNPSCGVVNISSPAKIDHIRVWDLSGRLMSETMPNASNTTLNIDAGGIYFAAISTTAGTVVRKLVVGK